MMKLARLMRFFYRLFQGISMCFVFFRTSKAYSKLKMALTAAFDSSPSSPGQVSTCYSPNSVRRGPFQDMSVEVCSETPQPLASPPSNSASPHGKLEAFSDGPRVGNSSVHFQESSGTPINRAPTDQFQFASPRRPTLTALNQNCHGFSHGMDLSGPPTIVNTGSSVTTHEENIGCDDSGVNGTRGFIEGNGLKLNRPPFAPNRRRPPALRIPRLTPCFQTENLTEELEREINVKGGSNYSVACKKGRREVMEDGYKAIVNISGDSRQAFFGVFDGHGGRQAAHFAAERLGENMVDELDVGKGKGACHFDMEDVVRRGYLTTDEAFSKQNVSSGTCCVTALIRGDVMVVANAGDCRAVLSRDGNAEALTCDHRLHRQDERQRIEDLGGYVDCVNGVWRVQGSLAVSRSIGDIQMKELISAEPEMKRLTVTRDCEFLILASDGLWDKVSNQEAVDTARALCSSEGCTKLVDVAVSRGSKDDVTVLIVDLKQFFP